MVRVSESAAHAWPFIDSFDQSRRTIRRGPVAAVMKLTLRPMLAKGHPSSSDRVQSLAQPLSPFICDMGFTGATWPQGNDVLVFVEMYSQRASSSTPSLLSDAIALKSKLSVTLGGWKLRPSGRRPAPVRHGFYRCHLGFWYLSMCQLHAITEAVQALGGGRVASITGQARSTLTRENGQPTDSNLAQPSSVILLRARTPICASVF